MNGNQDYFYNLFLQFLDRVFGEDTTCCKISPNWKRGARGGWLQASFDIKYEKLGSFSTLNAVNILINNHVDKSYLQKYLFLTNYAIELIDILQPKGDIFIQLTRSRKEFDVSFELLPKKSQMRLMRIPEYEYVKSSLLASYDTLFKYQDTVSLNNTQVS